jgi:hypothetical protein
MAPVQIVVGEDSMVKPVFDASAFFVESPPLLEGAARRRDLVLGQLA